jgi:hypothetical protein
MDLILFLRVIRRFRVLVFLGALLATVLAGLSFVKVDLADGPSLSHRSQEEWASYTRLLVTQHGFNWGDSLAGPSAEGDVGSQTAVEGRLPTLATIYASFVTSDDVMRLMLRGGPVRGVVQAAALPAGPQSSSVLPIVNISAIAFTAQESRTLADRAAKALRQYVDMQQDANQVAPADRIQLRVLNRGGQTELLSGRKKTMPIVIFMAVMFATVALAFVLENLRPSLRVVSEIEPVVGHEPARRATS